MGQFALAQFLHPLGAEYCSLDLGKGQHKRRHVEARGEDRRQFQSATTKSQRKMKGSTFHSIQFFTNKNDDSGLLMEVAEWWIKAHASDHFEKAIKIREMIRPE